jgi:hypothetical protein
MNSPNLFAWVSAIEEIIPDFTTLRLREIKRATFEASEAGIRLIAVFRYWPNRLISLSFENVHRLEMRFAGGMMDLGELFVCSTEKNGLRVYDELKDFVFDCDAIDFLGSELDL